MRNIIAFTRHIYSRSNFQYSTVYEVVVSDLFVHYLETDAITVEVYEVRGATHEQWGSAKITLKSLLTSKTPTKMAGKLDIKGSGSEAIVAILDYVSRVFDNRKRLLLRLDN